MEEGKIDYWLAHLGGGERNKVMSIWVIAAKAGLAPTRPSIQLDRPTDRSSESRSAHLV